MDLLLKQVVGKNRITLVFHFRGSFLELLWQ